MLLMCYSHSAGQCPPSQQISTRGLLVPGGALGEGGKGGGVRDPPTPPTLSSIWHSCWMQVRHGQAGLFQCPCPHPLPPPSGVKLARPAPPQSFPEFITRTPLGRLCNSAGIRLTAEGAVSLMASIPLPGAVLSVPPPLVWKGKGMGRPQHPLPTGCQPAEPVCLLQNLLQNQSGLLSPFAAAAAVMGPVPFSATRTLIPH